jgi:hypothetical protein
MKALPRMLVNGLIMPYPKCSGIQQQTGIDMFCEKGGESAHQVPAGKETDRSGGGGEKGDVAERKLTAPYFFFTS